MIAFSQWFFDKERGSRWESGGKRIPMGIGRIKDPDGNREDKGEG